MEPDQLQRFQTALVIFGSQSDPIKEERNRPAKKNCKLKKKGASRCISRASTRLDVSRSRSERVSSYVDCGTHNAEQRLPYAFSSDLFASDSSSHSEAPVDRLPVELLGEIFLRCLPDIYFVLPRPTLAPMLLCQISGHWRQVALATPKLWVRVTVAGRPHYNYSHLSLLELWMKRSLNHSLSLQFGPGMDFWDNRNPAFEIILSQSHRWRYLSLAFTERIADQFLTAYVGGVMSPVQVLKLDASACTDEQANQIVLVLNHFPHLRRLQFTRHTSIPLLGAPWSQMTHIWLTCPMSDQECLEILSRCSQVEDFRVSHITPANFTSSRKIILPKLFFLQMQSAEDARIFDNIDCPSLRNLHLKRWVSGSKALLSFADFLSRSGCQLESFHLHDDDLSEDDVISHLKAPPLKPLRTLELECRRLGSKTLKVLSCTENPEANILPSLQTIWFKHSFFGYCDILQQMTQSRLDRMVKQPDGVLGVSLKNVFVGRHRDPICREGKMLKATDIPPSALVD
ncbi:hypothetical protein L208DRAFT_1438232 [Tricholoma matsutake]|nr:hypothetical protein L208DRAFT_1438232 [Tricholoma matsutake 945]